MVEEIIMYGMSCDGCGEALIVDNGEYLFHSGGDAEESAKEYDWTIEAKGEVIHLCPDCYADDYVKGD